MTQGIYDSVQRVKDVFGEHLTENELAFLRETQRFFEAVLQKQRGFAIVAKIVSEKLQSFVEQGPPSRRLRLAFSAQAFRDTFDIDARRLDGAVPTLTEDEASFARDVIDAIDFVIRNGIGFGLIAAALGHDLREIFDPLNGNGSLDKAVFNSMVTGWAEYNRQTPSPTEPEET